MSSLVECDNDVDFKCGRHHALLSPDRCFEDRVFEGPVLIIPVFVDSETLPIFPRSVTGEMVDFALLDLAPTVVNESEECGQCSLFQSVSVISARAVAAHEMC